MTTLHLGPCRVEIHRHWQRTIFPDGCVADGVPEQDAESLARAYALGYGDDVWAMGREHDILHTLIAQHRGWEWCPLLRLVSFGRPWPAQKDTVGPGGETAGEIEAVVLGAQAWLRKGQWWDGLDVLPDPERFKRLAEAILKAAVPT